VGKGIKRLASDGEKANQTSRQRQKTAMNDSIDYEIVGHGMKCNVSHSDR